MNQDIFEGLPPLTKAQKQILTAKPGRIEKLHRHLESGGKLLTYLPLLIGDGYGEFWKTKKRYRVVKGSRASKKTITTARWYIYHLMKHKQANLLVVRKVGAVNKDSTYAELKKATYDLGVADDWKFKVNPLEAEYKPTGQKILFRGLDDPQKISGVTVTTGHLCWVWIEEAYEMKDESELDFVDESIRGILPDDLWYQITLTLNPWNKSHWIKKRFFDPIFGENEEFKGNPREDEQIFALSTNFFINEFIDDSFKSKMIRLKDTNPNRYHVAGLGNWGVTGGLVFEHWQEQEFDLTALNRDPNIIDVYGLDWGFTNDPTAFIHLKVDQNNMRIYAVKEFYEKGMSNIKIADKLIYMGYKDAVIIGDSSEPKSIEELYKRGIRRIRPARKGNDSVRAGIDKLQDYAIIADRRRTPNFCTELDNYMWNPDKPLEPMDEYNHLMDAFRYACEDIKSFNGFKLIKSARQSKQSEKLDRIRWHKKKFK